MNTKLKPCPFCGGEVDNIFTSHKTLQYREFHYFCIKCGAIIFLPNKSKYESPEQMDLEAAKAWNRRVVLIDDWSD